MKKAKNYWLFVLAAIPAVSMAQAYKCKQTDGSVGFQDHRCQTGAKQTTVTLAPVRVSEKASEPENGAMRKSVRTKQIDTEVEQDSESRRNEEAIMAQNEKVKAYNKAQRCNHARQQLGVLKESRPVYRRNNDGDRQYIEDKDRAAENERAEQSVAAECN